MLEYSYFLFLQLLSKLGKFFIEILPSFLLSSFDYGNFAYYYSLIIILSSLSVMGLHISLLRLVPEKKYKNLFFIVGDIQLVAFFLLLFILLFIVNDFNFYVYILILIFSISILQAYSTFFRTSHQIKKWFLYRETLFPLLVLVVLFLFYLFNIKLSLYTLFFILSLLSVISVILLFIHLYKFFKVKLFSIRNPFSKETIEVLKISIPMFFTGFTYLLLSRLDVLMLNYYINKEELGGYNIISRIAFQVLILWQVVSAYYMPKIAKKFVENNETQIILLHKKYLLLSIISTFFISIILVCGINFFPIHDYILIWNDKLKITMYIILIGQFISVFFSGYGYFILYIHKEKLAYLNSIFMLIIAIITNLIFIPLYGINGAALATALTIFFTKILEISEIYYYKKTIYLR